MKYNIEYEQELDGRWIAEIAEIPGALAYGKTMEEAASKVISIAFNVISEQIEISNYPDYHQISFVNQ